MAIFRNKYDAEFTILSNSLLGNPDLSWKAKGVLAYLLSLPHDWKIYLEEIETHATDGKDGLQSAIKELIQNKYIERQRVQDDKGRFKGYEYCIYSVPTENGISVDGETENGKPATTKINNTKIKEEDEEDALTQVLKNISQRMKETMPLKTIPVPTEETIDDEFNKVAKYFTENICELKSATAKQLKQYYDQYGYDYLIASIDAATELNAKSFKYLKNCIDNNVGKGIATADSLKGYLKAKSKENIALGDKERENRKKRAEGKPEYKQKNVPGAFDNFEQREYDYDDLERKLLGWDEVEG